MRRYKHGLSHYKLITGDLGQLLPVACYEVLPGDTVQQSTGVLIRTTPPATPVMHPINVRIHHFFVPNRLIWDGWEDFITGGQDGEGGSSGAYPTIVAGGGGFTANAITDCLGIPPGVASLEIGALPIRAINLIFNEFYRDQDLVTERPVPTDSGVDSTSPMDVPRIAWEKDYFTAARAWPQRGPDVTLPLGTRAPIRGIGAQTQVFDTTDVNAFETDGTGSVPYTSQKNTAGTGVDSAFFVQEDPDNPGFPNIWADLTGASSATVIQLREVFGLQSLAEARAMFGARYSEYLRYYGIRPSDARLQRPEYLGGGKQIISFSEVLQTGPDTSDEGVGTMKGHGIAAVRTNRYRRFFEEHGYVVSFMSARPRSLYSNGLHRMHSRRTREDYWTKELETIGMQEVLQKEVFAVAGAPGDVNFGYQDRYAEYRHLPSMICNEFRNVLSDWHLGRIFSSGPVALNDDFVQCDPGKRIFQEQTQHSLWCMVNNSIQARRMVCRPKVGRPL